MTTFLLLFSHKDKLISSGGKYKFSTFWCPPLVSQYKIYWWTWQCNGSMFCHHMITTSKTGTESDPCHQQVYVIGRNVQYIFISYILVWLDSSTSTENRLPPKINTNSPWKYNTLGSTVCGPSVSDQEDLTSVRRCHFTLHFFCFEKLPLSSVQPHHVSITRWSVPHTRHRFVQA